MSFTNLSEALGPFEAVIGLEVHAQLDTRSKLFSGAPAAFAGDHANVHVDPYTLGLPGTLPVPNRRVIEMALRTGLALGGTVNHRSVFARKHYFYPDLPKGYQISQYDQPIIQGGGLQIEAESGQPKFVRLARIHIEEDAGKSVHAAGSAHSLVDYNRAGVPLLEIVSEPDLRSPEEASRYLKALRAILMTLEVSDGNMQEGSFRCDANVSIRPRGQESYGTRCEIKNLNSFRFVEQALEHEILRHANRVAEGGTVTQETRLYDSERRQTRTMRTKEDALDYRYFPDPDLPAVELPPGWAETEAARLPELPTAKLERYRALGVPAEAARFIAEERDLARYFDEGLGSAEDLAAPLAQLVMGELLRELKDDPAALREVKVSAASLARLVRARIEGKISSTQQKKLFSALWREGGDVDARLALEGEQVSDDAALEPIVEKIIASNPGPAAEYRAGKTKLMGFFVGQVMKELKGKANPQAVQELLVRKLGGGAA